LYLYTYRATTKNEAASKHREINQASYK